jgi:hypothetical protein
MVRGLAQAPTMVKFLTKEFDCISKDLAGIQSLHTTLCWIGLS